MKILHFIHDDDPPLILRLQEQDVRLMSPSIEVETFKLGKIRDPELVSTVRRSGADLCHFYTRALPGGAALRGLPMPWVAPCSAVRWGLFRRHHVEPSRQVAPHPALGAATSLPEVVSAEYFDQPERDPAGPLVGGIVSHRTDHLYQAVRARITRYRDDVVWRAFPAIPSPGELSEIAVWVDLGVDEERETSGVPEAFSLGRAVIAPRTDLNRSRLLDGDAGFLVPRGDPNEMAHVILTALFKPEVTALRLTSALGSRDRFRPARRQAALEKLYRDVVAGE